MKGVLKLRPRRALSRAEAWGCLTANLALAGSGSLAAGYAIGYWQMATVFLAMILTCVTSIPMVQWKLSGAAAVSQMAGDDPTQQLLDLWMHARWPLASIALYVVAVLWALITSLTILSHSTKDRVPPHIV
ncbi:MAG TPA: hypothetical protein VK731_12020 [Candidatus Cybelea sp.]|jgi:hypothetical protein|nr:hypothetical protein [Candidatus Cybelea sp.]